MKKRILACLSFAALLTAGFSVALFSANKNIDKTEASSYTVNSVPSTIDLNDSTESEVRSYYSSLNNKSASERQGTNLLKNLKPILKNGQKYFSYGKSATTAVWQAYEIVDRDWDKSPASAISGYNANTNKITGYTYGTSNSNPGSDPYVHALYVNRNVTNQTKAWGNHNQDQWGINQEHVWAKSCGFNDNSPSAGARGDLMHLWAGNGKVNGTYHSNYYYGYVDTTKSYDDASSYASTLSGNRKGKSKTLGGSYTVFEPQDSDKGDIARALFYMAARYNYLSGSDSDGIDAGNPNLEIINQLNWAPGDSYTSSTSTKGQMGILQDLLEWNRLDPPDAWEIHRNNLLYKNFTNNRNPFIDFPEWAEFIWGKSVNGSYSSSSTGSASPSNDTVNDFSAGGSSISVSGVSVTPTSATIGVDATLELKPTISPSNASNQNVTWSTSNSSVATVSNGIVTGKSAGSATITVRTNDGGYTATCLVTVKTISSLTISGYQTEFEKGDEFVFGGTVTANFSPSGSANVTSLASFSGYNMNTPGTHTVTVTYGNKYVTYDITVTGSSSTTDTEDGSVSAASGALSGWTAVGTGSAYADGSVKFDGDGDNVYKIDIFSGDVSSGMTSLTVTINGKINGSPTSANSYKVEALDSNGNVLASDVQTGADIVTTSYGDTIFTISSGLSGCTGIRITYVTKGGGNWGIKTVSWTATYTIYSGPVLTGITLDTSEVQTSFNLNEEFNYNDLVVTAHYSDDSSEVVDPESVSTPDMSTEGNKTITVSYLDKQATYTITVTNAVSSISATVKNNKVFFVGETIRKSDIVVTTNTGIDITNSISFSDYTFRYSDANSGGSLTNKEFTITFNEFACNLTAQVKRKAHENAGTVSDALNLTFTGQSGNSYGSWTNKSAPNSTAVYSGNNAGGNSSIQLRSSTSSGSTVHAGIVTTTSGGNISNVTVVWEGNTIAGRTLNVFGKNTAYTDQDDLYNDSTKGTLLGTIVKGTSTSLTITGSYAYVGVCSDSGAMYLTSVTFTFGSEDSATNLSNYIMYEDTTGQCISKTSVAVGYFEGLSSAERSTFMTSSDYVISTARERFNAWLQNQGKSVSYSNNDYVVNNAIALEYIGGSSTTIIIVIVFSAAGLFSIGGYFYFRRKKGNYHA